MESVTPRRTEVVYLLKSLSFPLGRGTALKPLIKRFVLKGEALVHLALCFGVIQGRWQKLDAVSVLSWFALFVALFPPPSISTGIHILVFSVCWPQLLWMYRKREGPCSQHLGIWTRKPLEDRQKDHEEVEIRSLCWVVGKGQVPLLGHWLHGKPCPWCWDQVSLT